MKTTKHNLKTISGSERANQLLREIKALTGMLNYRVLEEALEQYLQQKREEQK